MTTEALTEHHVVQKPKRNILLRPGFLRAAWMMLLFFGIGAAIMVTVRYLEGWYPLWKGDVITTISLTTIPLGFLSGIGVFDYWVSYFLGKPTVPDDHSSHGAYSWKDYFKVNTDHKVIGVQYLGTNLFFLLVGGMLALIMRAELARPGMQVVDPQTFNGLFSVHAALLIFLVIVPAFAGLANYVLPLMIGAPDMAFPRLNALSFWLLPMAGTIMLSSLFCPGGPFATGWTGYAPLAVHQPLGQVFFNMGVQWAGASSIMTALNFLVTIITMRAPGMTFWRMPLLVWANFTTSLLVVLATPFIAGSQFFVMFDRVMHTNFFNVSQGGYTLAYQHIFWFYSHPAVYIMVLPGFGIISEVISIHSRKPIFGYRLMAMSLLAILVLGFSVWAHHMFVAGMAPWLRVPMMITTLLIAIPTGIKVFSWLATMWEGKLHFTTPMLFVLGFISMFLLGGLSGIYLGSVPVDIHASDTYFVVAHIHYVLFGGALFTIFAGVYHWFPKMTGRMYNEKLGKLHFWLTFVGFNLHVPADAPDRPPGDAAPRLGLRAPVRRLEHVHLDLVLRARRLDDRVPLQRDLQLALRRQGAGQPVERAHDRVARLLAAAGLQLRRDPAGRRRPVRVRRARGPPRDHGALARTRASGGADSLMEAHAAPHHGPPIAHASSKVNREVLGMFLFIASEVMVFGAFFAMYFFIRVVNGVPWPTPPFHLPVYVAGINTLILVTSSFTMHWALTSIKKGNRAGMQAGLVLTVLMGLTFLLTQLMEYSRIGFAPSNGAFGSVFYSLTGLHGAHVLVGLTILTCMTIRAFRGHFSPEHHDGVEIAGIYWHFVDVMWIVVYTTIYIL